MGKTPINGSNLNSSEFVKKISGRDLLHRFRETGATFEAVKDFVGTLGAGLGECDAKLDGLLHPRRESIHLRLEDESEAGFEPEFPESRRDSLVLQQGLHQLVNVVVQVHSGGLERRDLLIMLSNFFFAADERAKSLQPGLIRVGMSMKA
jgi:hypothetical protein